MNETNVFFTICSVLIPAYLSFSLIPIAEKIACRLKAIDVPQDERRMHTHPIPRTGGLAIATAFLLGIILLAKITPATLYAAAGAFIIIFAGITDDIKAISPHTKLLFQLAGATAAALGGFSIDAISLPGSVLRLGAFSFPFSILWIVTLLNAHNFIDGIDGLAGSVGIVEAAALAMLSLVHSDADTAIYCLCLAGAILGFLPHNFSPARIFMGDTGSMLTGFILSLVSLRVMSADIVSDVASSLAVFVLPLTDLCFSVTRRIASGKNPFFADRGHLHHLLCDGGFSQSAATLSLTAFSFLSSAFAVFPQTLIFFY